MNTNEIVKALRWLAKDTEFIFAAGQLNGAANLIESLQAQLAESQRRERAAVKLLRTIDWVGSGAKGRIEDAIAILSGDVTGEGDTHD